MVEANAIEIGIPWLIPISIMLFCNHVKWNHFLILRTFPDIEGEIINILLESRISNCSLIYDKYSILFFGIVTLAELWYDGRSIVTVETPSSLSISKVPTLSQVSEEKAAPCKSKIAFNWLQKVIFIWKGLKRDSKPVQTKSKRPRWSVWNHFNWWSWFRSPLGKINQGQIGGFSVKLSQIENLL